MLQFFLLLAFLNSNNPKIKIDNAWVRPSGEGMNSALYFNMTNQTPKTDTLYKVVSSAAELVQIHETVNKNGLMEMKEVKSVAVQENKTIQFAPGGYHVMLIKLRKDFKAGEKVAFTFFFKLAGKVKVIAVVKKN